MIVDSIEALDRLAEAWSALAAASGSPVQDFVWARACAESFGSSQELQVVVAGPEKRPRAIAPLVLRGPLSRLELLGVKELSEPADLLYRDETALTELAAALAARRLPLLLERVPDGEAVAAALRRAYRGRGLVVAHRAPSAPYILLDPAWRRPEERLSAGRRSDFRRARRNAEKLGPVTSEVLSPGPNELAPLLDAALRVEAAGWKGKRGTALAQDAVRGAFFRSYAAAAAERGILRLCLLRIGGAAAAMQVAVEYGNRFWLLKIGYDDRFARASPGQLLMLETVRYAAERELASYELLGRVEPWTRRWTDHARPCVSLHAYPARPRGALALAADAASLAARKVRTWWR